MKTYDTIRTVEERSLNAWPSLHQMLYDGWVLGFSNGYTRRANSVSPIYRGNRGIYEKVLGCEEMYRRQRLQTTFKITPLAYPRDLDALLEDRGYQKEATTSVQMLNLKAQEVADTGPVEVREEADDDWLSDYARIKGMAPDEVVSFRAILDRIAAPKWFVSLAEDGEMVSAGLAVQEGDCAGLFGVVTDEARRNRGFGRRLVLTLLNQAKAHGAYTAYLMVTVTNDPALKLYAGLGFEEIYRYWYRVKGN